MKHIITIIISCIIYVGNIYALDKTNSFSGMTKFYKDPAQAMMALQSTNYQSARNAYYSFAIIGKPAIPILLANAYNTNIYENYTHWSWRYSSSPGNTTLGIVGLYLVESIIHKCTHPHYAAGICSTNKGYTLTRYRYDDYDIQTNIAKYYNTWWKKNSSFSLHYIRKHDINPLKNSPYIWEGYTQYMDKTVIQLTE